MTNSHYSDPNCGSKTLELIEESIDLFKAQCTVCREEVVIFKNRYSKKQIVDIRKEFINA